MHSTFRNVLLALVLISPWLFATSPLPPPYHQYRVGGFIQRAPGGSLKDFAIVLTAKDRNINAPSFEVLKRGDLPVALTDSTGWFYVIARSDIKADSLAVGVVIPDRPIVLGAAIAVYGVQTLSKTETYTENQSGCSGCDAPNNATRTRVVSYEYYFPDQIVVLDY